jgi:NADPH:quinone reductase-like Zn-dependent oxidoreductase
MKAIRIHQHGGPDMLRVDKIEKPQCLPDKALIRIKMCSLNHLDVWVRKGIPGVTLPLIMGSDCAGNIEEIGKLAVNPNGLKIGDEVLVAPVRSCGECEKCISGHENLCPDFKIPGEHVDGVQAEYITIEPKYLFKKPSVLTWEETAALPLVTLTAYHMLIQKAKIQKENSLLIWGASSGVGSMAIQIAKVFDAFVITTVGSDEKAEMAEKLGADHVINYKTQPVGRIVRELTDGKGVDIVFEHTGAKTWADSLRAMKKGGKLVTCGATTGPLVKIDLRALFIKQQQLIGSTMGTLQDMREIMELVEQGKLKPVIDKVFPFEQISEAHARIENGEQFGKVVVSF